MALIAAAIVGVAIAGAGIARAVLEQRKSDAAADAKSEKKLDDAIARANQENAATSDDENGKWMNFWNGVGNFISTADDAVIRAAAFIL